ncbi:hypothetical protein HDU79_002796 [Rhizoclosmatium sp. JEL0117]|nr:hypothetical protein HDU79_002796 [Rhizoclosmatium sp. JEL0117]
MITESKRGNKTFIPLSHPSLVTSGCPSPKQALIGVFTQATKESSFHRTVLRKLYETSPAASAFDIKYVFGNGADLSMDSALAIEEMFYPDDTVVTPRRENRDAGKILDWFKWARSEMYTKHPTKSGKVCLKCRFVGKSDEDAVIHLERLQKLLEGLKGDMDGTARFIGRSFETPVLHMTGMLYLLSANAVEWIDSAEIAATYFKGIEDVIVGYWMSSGNITVDYIEQGKKFHDLAESNSFSDGDTTDETVVLHWCKDANRMYRCILELFGNREATGRTAERLTTAQALETRLDSFYLAERKDWNETVAAAKNLVHETSTTKRVNVTQIDSLLFRPYVIEELKFLGLLSNLTSSEIDNLVYRVSLEGYHANPKRQMNMHDIDDHILYYLVKYRFPEEQRYEKKGTIYRIGKILLKTSQSRAITLDEVDEVIKKVLEEGEIEKEKRKQRTKTKA